MGGTIIVMEPRDYEVWLASREGGEAVAKTGEELFVAQTCNTCHRPDSAVLAPILHGAFGRQEQLTDGSVVTIDENYLRESILNPGAKIVAGYNAIMPTYQGRVSEEDLVELILYIKSLGATSESTADDGSREPNPETEEHNS